MCGHEDNLNFMFCTFFTEKKKKKNRESEDLIFINNRRSFLSYYIITHYVSVHKSRQIMISIIVRGTFYVFPNE